MGSARGGAAKGGTCWHDEDEARILMIPAPRALAADITTAGVAVCGADAALAASDPLPAWAASIVVLVVGLVSSLVREFIAERADRRRRRDAKKS